MFYGRIRLLLLWMLINVTKSDRIRNLTMAKMKNNKIPRRSGTAQAALSRRAPTMDHRCEPRGGTKNLQAEYLDGAEPPDYDLDYDIYDSES